MKQGELRRVLTLPLLTFYGVGTILGAGIYVLVGKVAGVAGMHTPFAFIVASILATFSALSYAELSARFPRNAGEAVYVAEGLQIRSLAIAVGILIVFVGITSTATLMNGIVGYVREFVNLPAWQIIVSAVIALCVIVIWGINQSVWIAALMTLAEIVGLLIIIWVARDGFWQVPQRYDELLPTMNWTIWTGVLSGALLAFYAYIGFEDIVNVADEVKQAKRNVPRAVILSLVITSILYLLVSLSCILVISPAQLAASDAPLALVYTTLTGRDAVVITAISIVSVLNGALVQVIMGSRMLHGINDMHWRHRHLAFIHARTGTPVVSIVLVSVAVLLLALAFPTVKLATLTSYLTLSVFSLINLSLWRIKLHSPGHDGVRVPLWIPVCGFFSSVLFIVVQLF